MKHTKYTVYFNNGKSISIFATSFRQAIILGMAYAIKNAWDYTIDTVTDERGLSVVDIQPPSFQKITAENDEKENLFV